MQESTTKTIEEMQRTTSDSIKELTGSISSLVNQLKETDNMSRNAISKMDLLELRITEQEKKQTKTENIYGWVAKTVGGMLILAILGLVLIQKQ